LFCIGATLGNALAPLLNMPFPLLAGMGFVAVFAGAANTPIASTLMAMEPFGAEVGIYAMVACVVSICFQGIPASTGPSVLATPSIVMRRKA
jgi:H+/Cl- antiporter ClcA